MPDRSPDASGFLTVGNRQIYWEYFGQHRHEPVCLLNGLAMHTRAWHPFLDHLLPGFDVLLYDYPGQGQSTSRDEPCDIPTIADYLAMIANRLDLPRLHVVGVSYGGFVAVEFARLYQDRLLTLTLSGILLSHEMLFEMYEALSLRFYRAGPHVFDLYTHYMYEKIFGEAFVRSVGAERLEAMRQRFYERYVDRIFSLIRLTRRRTPSSPPSTTTCRSIAPSARPHWSCPAPRTARFRWRCSGRSARFCRTRGGFRCPARATWSISRSPTCSGRHCGCS